MGLFWSMKPTPGQSPGLRLIKRDVTTPYDVTMAVHWGHEDLMNAQTKPAITRTITRHFMTSDVQRIPINLGRLTGTLFIPNGTHPDGRWGWGGWGRGVGGGDWLGHVE